jgi:sodium-dependent dicarboxylate transporter 2/3/5
MLVAFPIALIMLIFVWFLITKVMFKAKHSGFLDNSVINEEYKQLGRISYEEKLVLIVFIMTGLLWMFRTDLDLGAFQITGWAGLLGLTGKVDDGTIAIAMASIMFILPAKNQKSRILTANSFSKIPWEIVVLFGGGFALAKGFQISGLSEFVGNMFIGGSEIHPLLLILLICFGITFLTELTSNTATAQTLLPIIASVSVALHYNPLFLMIPATISASFAFMLPVATPPNAIVFSSGKLKIKDMAKAGLIINLAGVIIISLIFYFLGDILFNIDLLHLPEWAVIK